MKIKDNYQRVPIEKVKVNKWNPNEQTEFIFKHARKSLRDQGQLLPILVREVGKDFEIIDGEHRYRGALAEGADDISVNNLGRVSDQVAKQLTIIMNETRGEARRDKLSALLHSLEDSLGLEELLASLPIQETEIQSLLGSNEVDWTQTNDLSEPVVVGEDASPMNPVADELPAPKPKDARNAVIALEVDKELHGLFFEQLQRVQAEFECDAPEALAIMLQIVEASDLEAQPSKANPVILRKRAKA